MQYKVRTREVVEKTYHIEADSPEGAEEIAFDRYQEADDEFFDDWYILSVEQQ